MILDIIVVAIFLISAFLGYKKGFVKILARIIGFILAVVLAYTFSDSLAKYLYTNVDLGANVKNDIQGKVEEYIENNSDDTENSTDNIKTPKFISKIINVINVDADSKEDTSFTLSEKVIMFLFKGVSFVIIMVLVTTAIWIIGILLDGVFSLPVLKTFNELGGLIASVVLTLLKLWIVLGIIGFLSPLEMMESVTKVVSNSYITNILYNNNIFINLILRKII